MADIEGTMVIRAWAEPGPEQQLRARLISSRPGQDQETVEAAGDAAEVVEAVRRWLDQLQAPDNAASA
ncbi:MAG: hypothetical protein JWQ75_752 [Pseudarthrobacter sp.]|nr:hypothetical protein [Pseudarthrobacter sp.]